MVYPRLCGGTTVKPAAIERALGLSPPVRGNLGESPFRPAVPGSIPACAGEPGLRIRLQPPSAVYPRLCGGTAKFRHQNPAPPGLSPPVRGNLDLGQRRPPRRRSIPACAGEPGHPQGDRGLLGVYPRLCGGTSPCATRRLI